MSAAYPGPCRLCGAETTTVVNIELRKMYLCDVCCLAVTRQTVNDLTVRVGPLGFNGLRDTEIVGQHPAQRRME